MTMAAFLDHVRALGCLFCGVLTICGIVVAVKIAGRF